jgi:predicted aspartyl protease
MEIQKAKEALESIFNVKKPSESTFSVQEMSMDGEEMKTAQVDSKMDSKVENMEEVHLKNEIFDFIKIEDFENVEQEDRESIEILIDGSNPVKFLLDSGSDTQIMFFEEYQKMFPDTKVENLKSSIIKVASDKLVKTHVTRLTYAHKGIMLTNVRTHIVNSEINIVGRTLMKKLGYSIKYTPPKTKPMINEKFYTKEELDEIKELLPEILKIVEKLEKYRGLSKIRPMKINFTNGLKPI